MVEPLTLKLEYEDTVMADHIELYALAVQDCFSSESGVAWRVANDMLHLPVPTMRQHIEDLVMEPCGLCRRYENCPAPPMSIGEAVVTDYMHIHHG